MQSSAQAKYLCCTLHTVMSIEGLADTVPLGYERQMQSQQYAALKNIMQQGKMVATVTTCHQYHPGLRCDWSCGNTPNRPYNLREAGTRPPKEPGALNNNLAKLFQLIKARLLADGKPGIETPKAQRPKSLKMMRHKLPSEGCPISIYLSCLKLKPRHTTEIPASQAKA